jgi:hypothetical protein
MLLLLLPLLLLRWQLRLLKGIVLAALRPFTPHQAALLTMRLFKLVSLPARLPLKLLHKLSPRRRRRQRLEAMDMGAATTMTASGKKSAEFHAEEEEEEKKGPMEDCPICHDPVGLPNPENVTEAWTSLHCGHRFGTVCIQMWLQDSLDRNDPHNPNPTCPICRVMAKHPGCGHAVCPPQDLEMIIYIQNQQYLAAAQAALDRRPHRNRLQRREGHPSRPPSVVPRRLADTIGECPVCERAKMQEEEVQRGERRSRQKRRLRELVRPDQGSRHSREARDEDGDEESEYDHDLEHEPELDAEEFGEGRSGTKAPTLQLPLHLGLLSSHGESSSRGRDMGCGMEPLSRPRRSLTPAPVGDLRRDSF